MLLDLHPGLMIWTILTFLVLLLILRAVAWKPILAMLEQREQKIKGDLETAAKNRSEAENTMADIQKQLESARKEANEIVSKSRHDAERVREETINQARDESLQLMEKAKAEIQLEREKAVQALKEQFAELAVLAAGQIIQKTLSPEDHIQIIRKTIGEIN